MFAAQRLRETDDQLVQILSHWIDRQLKETRPTGKIVAEVDKARRLLRYLAGIRCDIALHPEPTTRLIRENVRRAFWSLPLQLDEEDQGWRLIDLACRSGLLSHVTEEWVFCDAAIQRCLAAEYASEETTWVSLQPRHRALMKWTAALVARRGTPRQQRFFDQLRAALTCATPVSVLDAAEFVAEFNQAGSRVAEAFKAEISESLNHLRQSASNHVRAVAEQRWQLLTENTHATNGPDLLVRDYYIELLEAEAHDLVGLLHQLGITRPTGDEDRWLDDRHVLNALLDGLSQAPTTDLKRQCAAWLHRSDLSKRVEIQFRARVPWKSSSRSALEVIADLARNPDQTADIQTLARSILVKDDWLLRLWQLGDAYTPLVCELLLALDKRLRLIR